MRVKQKRGRSSILVKWRAKPNMHFFTNYVIRESQAKTSVHPIKKGRAKRGKAAIESWGHAKDKLNISR